MAGNSSGGGGRRTGGRFVDGKVDTSNFSEAYKSIEKMAKSMGSMVDDLNDYKADIVDNWVGNGRNQFEKSYKILLRKLKDGRDITWDLYENLIEAEGILLQADIDIAKTSYTEQSESGRF